VLGRNQPVARHHGPTRVSPVAQNQLDSFVSGCGQRSLDHRNLDLPNSSDRQFEELRL
jgi:hypothetical protein